MGRVTLQVKSGVRGGVGLILIFLAATILPVSADPPPVVVPYLETFDSWTPPETEVKGWELFDALNWRTRPMSNVGGALNATFGSQTISFPASYIVRTTSVSPASNFHGNYWAGGISKIKFRFYAEDLLPHSVRVYVHTPNGDLWWYHPIDLSAMATGQWYDMEAILSYAQGWFNGIGDTEGLFNASLQNVDWIGVYIRRNGSMNQQDYRIDDVEVEGTPAAGSISGLVSYSGEQSGGVKVLATTVSNSWSLQYSTLTVAGSGYSISNVPTLADYYVKAYMDSNGNGSHDFWEALGWYNNGAVLPHLLGDASGIDLALLDPGTEDGIAYWWLREYFGITSPNDPIPGPNDDLDGDGATLWEEWMALTDPTDGSSVFHAIVLAHDDGILIKWNGPSDKTYSVWRCDDLSGGAFVSITTGFGGSEFLDTESAEGGPYFYRVQLEEAIGGE